jgi:hypothetical protein
MVDLVAQLQNLWGLTHIREQVHRLLHPQATLMDQVGKLAGFRRQISNIVELKGLGGILDEIEYIVHAGDQMVNVLAIQRGNERPMQECHRFVSYPIGVMFELENASDALLTFMFLARKSSQQLGQHGTGGNNLLRVAIEEIKESRLARHQLGQKLHDRSSWRRG